jgi:hypothetical protein
VIACEISVKIPSAIEPFLAKTNISLKKNAKQKNSEQYIMHNPKPVQSWPLVARKSRQQTNDFFQAPNMV